MADDILSTQVQLAPECLREFVASKLPEGVEFNIPAVTEAQIEKSLKSLNTTKATGIYGSPLVPKQDISGGRQIGLIHLSS